MNRALVFAFVVVATGVPMAAEAESPDRVDPVLDCATPVLDADTPEKARLLRVQYGADAMVRQLRQTYAPRLAGLFWEETEGEDSRLVLRLTGDEPVQNERMTVCGELLIVEFVPGQMHTREELQKIHSNNLEWFRGKFPGLQGTYADERTGEIVLQIYEPEAGSDVEAITNEAESRLGAPLRVEMITAKVVPQ
ncbi:hypothetical protein [Brucella grignonensis]|uniref:Uncharacterized protein n=1 Tax=Brucella grignonensis TaxID=94627 RepID=A0A256FS81_9HYPH|nr:hypothetical protein [Brucella grignonensis]OYR17707.1 hypothetical protein CEV33_4937 [Brucella grignonensis]